MSRSFPRLLSAGLVALALVAGLLPPALKRHGLAARAASPMVVYDEQLNAALASLEQSRLLLRSYQADRAFTQLQTALKLFAEMKDLVGQAAAHDSLGDVYAQSGQYDRAFEHYRSAHENFRQAGDTANMNAVLAKRAERHLLLGDLDGARAAFAAMILAPPDKSLKDTGVVALAAKRRESDKTGAAAAAANDLAVCYAPVNPSDNIDPKNPPNQGRAPVTQNGLGRMDLRVVDEAGKPLKDVQAKLESKRPGGFICDCMKTTDAAGRALLPPLHIADQVKLVLSVPGLPAQELTMAAQSLAEPVRVALSQAGARLLPRQDEPPPPGDPCFDFYRAFVAYASRELGTARLEFFAGRLPESRKRHEDLLTQLNLPGVERFRPTRRFRAAALTALGDIASREGRFEDAAKLYKGVLDTATKEQRLDLMWAAQRGLGRSLWQQYLAAPDGARASRLRGDAMGLYLAAVRTLDALRAGSLRADESRTAFLAGARDIYDEALEVLGEMALIATGPAAKADASTKAVVLADSAKDMAAAAVAVVEQSRARSLLDMLGEARSQISEGLPADLLKRRNEVVARQQEIADILGGVALPDAASRKSVAELELELEHLAAVYDGLENDIRTRSPRYATLTDARPLALADIQRSVLDDQTALLLYNLGDDTSYLWVVTQSGVAVSRLPARSVIESKVSALRAQLIPSRLRRPLDGIDAPADASRGLTHGADAKPAPPAATKMGGRAQASKQGAKGRAGKTANAPKAGGTKAPAVPPQASNAGARAAFDAGAYARAAHDLYNAVLSPAAAVFAQRRLVVVADGPLSFVPFEALVTAPSAAGAGSDFGALPFLVKTNEVAYAPSASVVGAVRRQRQQGATAARRGGPVLVVADPVFSASDARVQASAAAPPAEGDTVARGLTLGSAVASVSGAKRPAAGAPQIPRLAGTRTEANEIAQLARAAAAAADVWLDLDASESNVRGRDMSRYGVIHFATHGLLDARQPQFTGLVLSLVGESEADGFLRVGEVFNFRLGSPLVMLSACETGLGRAPRGEGVIGLPRAFMYAGANTVGVSLWAVSDRSTALLMSDFYRGLFADARARPADALRRAQLKMLADPRYNAPYYWAPFILLGDWT